MYEGIAVQGMAFGDEGKGAVTDYLTRVTGAGLVVRFNGGPQAAHNVIHQGVHHTFSQFGSGSLAGAATFLSRYMLVEPMALAKEWSVLKGKGGNTNLVIDPAAVLVTPWARLLNHMVEVLRGKGKHGSVGLGIGMTRMLQLHKGVSVVAGDALDYELLGEKLRTLKMACLDFAKELILANGATPATDFYLQHLIATNHKDVRDNFSAVLGSFPQAEGETFLAKAGLVGPVIFEGAQGALLDEKYGTAPHNTWTNCTFENAQELAQEAGIRLFKLGVFRTYFTRHGEGPFPSELREPALSDLPHEVHNKHHEWMGAFRRGLFDLDLAERSMSFMKPDALALTHGDVPVREMFRSLPFTRRMAGSLPMELERELDTKVVMVRSGPNSHSPTSLSSDFQGRFLIDESLIRPEPLLKMKEAV